MARTFVVPDLHGRFDLLEKALASVQDASPSGGTVIFLGDYIDRGPQSRQVIECLMAGPPGGWTWVVLKGNHEAMMVQCHDGPDRRLWQAMGGTQTLASYGGCVPAAHLDWAARLPLLHLDAHRIYVHAGVDPCRPLEGQGEAVLLWMRYSQKEDLAIPGFHVVHGHTPRRRGPERLSGRTNLDTGAVFFGRLVVGVFDDDLPGGPTELIEIKGSAKVWARIFGG